jgi:hypothetical protein
LHVRDAAVFVPLNSAGDAQRHVARIYPHLWIREGDRIPIRIPVEIEPTRDAERAAEHLAREPVRDLDAPGLDVQVLDHAAAALDPVDRPLELMQQRDRVELERTRSSFARRASSPSSVRFSRCRPCEAISRLDPDETKTAKEVLDGLIPKHEARRWVSSG